MKLNHKSRASILISALIIFLLISSLVLMVYTYSSNNLKQAKTYEEHMHAYFLAYSGCEIAYAALLKEGEDFSPTDINKKWEEYTAQFKPTNTAFLNNHKYCISLDGSIGEAGYNRTVMQEMTGPTLDAASFPEFKDAAIYFKIDKVPDDAAGEEAQYKGFIRIEATAKTHIGSSGEGTATKYLYVDAVNKAKIYWR